MFNSTQAGFRNLGRILFLIYIILLIYDGALRKWIFPTYEKYIFFIKDIIFISIAGLALFILKWRKFSCLPIALLTVVPIYVLCVLPNAFNPNLPSPLVGFLGIKLHLMPIFLIVVVAALYKNQDDFLDQGKRFLPFLVLPVCLIAMTQVSAPQDSMLNQAVRGGLNSVPGMRDLVRASGTFSYVTGFSAFLIAAFSFTLVANLSTKFKFNILLLILLVVISALPTNGSRAVLMSAAIIAILTFTALIWKKLIDINTIIKIFSVLGVSLILVVIANPDPWQALMHRFMTSYHLPGETARFHSGITNAFNFFTVAGLFGFGTGSASQLAPFLVPSVQPYSWLPETIAQIGFEEESGRIVLELGVVGWLSSMLMRLVFLYYSVRLIFIARTSNSTLVGLMSAPILALGVMFGTGVFSPPIGAIYYWLCVALMIQSTIEVADIQSK